MKDEPDSCRFSISIRVPEPVLLLLATRGVVPCPLDMGVPCPLDMGVPCFDMGGVEVIPLNAPCPYCMIQEQLKKVK